ncbi:hypothetical protein D9M69_513870 [compost metagenome]
MIGQQGVAADQHFGLALGGGNGGVGVPGRPGVRAAVVQQDSRLARQQVDELHVVGAQTGTAQGFDRQEMPDGAAGGDDSFALEIAGGVER